MYSCVADVNQDELIMQRCREIEKEVMIHFMNCNAYYFYLLVVDTLKFFICRFVIQPAWLGKRKI